SMCPKTYQALTSLPLARIPGRSPNILFSKIKAGTHIQPHHGQLNCRMFCHIPLIVPGNCKLRVGNQEKSVQEGELLIFDDSIEHEAFNNSSQDRIVLIIDLWRPELTAEEQKIICSLLEIVDEFQQK
ncbi:MAG: aspartyl/asparaginyl beta-hydroxylase domain-containing protein, partial [Kangiellaceae bacterium]|nr:aspartyl/asparaginyl beta-hydroxylase domain-containing protein [Kangiellaceae bacterium]